MKTRSSLLSIAALVLIAFTYVSPAHAQATRTWVSGVGDDANPCSRTAPCKTFAGAISKTAAGGEINCIDPGGFGAVTITKAITIDCANTDAGVLVAGTNGIIVNAGRHRPGLATRPRSDRHDSDAGAEWRAVQQRRRIASSRNA